MMFYLSKLSFLVVQPLYWVAMLLLSALAISILKSGVAIVRVTLAMALSLLLLIGWSPLSNAALRGLEDRYLPPTGDLSRFAGMIVLGGAFAGDDGRNRGPTAIGCSGERVVAPVPIMNQYPRMRLLFTGGEAALFPRGEPEAGVARRYFERMGVATERLVYEGASRNTYENAVMSARLPAVDVKAPWLLVTSASHMPRAAATFAHAGWNVTPYPVDYVSSVDTSPLDYSLSSGVSAWQIALREYVGLIAYRVTGRI
jgi:uncharacterized SAM-binding protein YcdF (DUF218 family)